MARKFLPASSRVPQIRAARSREIECPPPRGACHAIEEQSRSPGVLMVVVAVATMRCARRLVDSGLHRSRAHARDFDLLEISHAMCQCSPFAIGAVDLLRAEDSATCVYTWSAPLRSSCFGRRLLGAWSAVEAERRRAARVLHSSCACSKEVR